MTLTDFTLDDTLGAKPDRPGSGPHARSLALALILTLAGTTSWAQTRVSDAWVRGTVAAQKSTGLFAIITSSQGGALVSASSPVAGTVEIHEMKMDGDIMRMRALPRLELPAGKKVELKPGGYHVMLLDLKQPLKAGDTVTVSLVVEAADKSRETIEIKAPVKAANAAAGGGHSEHKH